ncbi:heme-binding protein [Neorhizobium sp. JUb45]|uniref:GlcG/HbpS family heme-binding protein n=1 Tax=Neorhizobium sp. JUb45 TaxID=2485113 RepID=UPI0010EFF13D|nr:heme-binding protein [Neorhizobium sp. JUb45]TCQ99327.1 uncharacterized protein GlcG (DUF336 family) [Neorhizobium sp. JUb45]
MSLLPCRCQAFVQSMPPYGAPITLKRTKQAVAAAVVDSGSNLAYLERSDQAGIGTIDAAIGKAKAANCIKTPTKAIEDMIVNRNQNNLLAVSGAFSLEGGVPIIVDDKVIGAIGASAGMPADDGAVANAGAKDRQP